GGRRDDPQRRRAQSGAGALPRRRDDARGHRPSAARRNVLAQRHRLGRRARDAHLGLELPHDLRRRRPLGGVDPRCRRGRRVTLAEAAAQADELAQAGSERELADLRSSWQDDLEGAARSDDFRERAVAFRAIGQFRWRAKEELLRRGLDDESPAARGSALLSLELLSRDHPSTINGVRPLLHTLATADGNAAVRRLAILCLKNGSPQRETIVLLEGLAQDDEADAELRRAAGGVAQQL